MSGYSKYSTLRFVHFYFCSVLAVMSGFIYSSLLFCSQVNISHFWCWFFPLVSSSVDKVKTRAQFVTFRWATTASKKYTYYIVINNKNLYIGYNIFMSRILFKMLSYITSIIKNLYLCYL